MKDAEIMCQNARFRSSWEPGGDLITLTVRVAGATVVNGVIGHSCRSVSRVACTTNLQHLADRRRRSTSVCAVAACNWRAVGCRWANRGSREAVAPALCSTSRAGDALGRRPAVLRTSSSNRTLCALWCEGTDCRLGSGVGSRMPALPGEIRLGSS